jgi:hypothetical protein
MAKITLEFDSIEEEDDARTALDGYKWKLLAWDLNQALRDKVKYCPDNEDPQAYEAIRNKLHELLEEYKLNLD